MVEVAGNQSVQLCGLCVPGFAAVLLCPALRFVYANLCGLCVPGFAVRGCPALRFVRARPCDSFCQALQLCGVCAPSFAAVFACPSTFDLTQPTLRSAFCGEPWLRPSGAHAASTQPW
eukprot:362000-Chlamydomonas_euryale.AAC.10